MSNITEGLTVAGEPGPDLGVNSEAGFNAALAAKVSRDREPEAAPAEEERSAPVAPDTDDAAAIKRQLLSDEGSTAVKDGLVAKDGERERIRADYEDSLRRIGIDPDEPPAPTPVSPDSLELAELRADAAETRFWEAILEEGYDKVFEHFATLRSHIGPERAEEVAHEFIGIDEDTSEDSHLWNELEALDDGAAQVAARAEFQATAAMAEALREHISEQTLRDTKVMVNDWKRDQGISAAEARARISRAENELGVSLVELAQQFGVPNANDVLRSLDSTLVGQEEAARDYRFKERMLAEPSTSVSEGLTINAGLGDVPLVPRPALAPRLNQDRVVRRAVHKGRTTTGDIKRGVAKTDQIQRDMDEMRKLATKIAGEQQPKPRTPAGF
jgi:hypothetical protein